MHMVIERSSRAICIKFMLLRPVYIYMYYMVKTTDTAHNDYISPRSSTFFKAWTSLNFIIRCLEKKQPKTNNNTQKQVLSPTDFACIMKKIWCLHVTFIDQLKGNIYVWGQIYICVLTIVDVFQQVCSCARIKYALSNIYKFTFIFWRHRPWIH